MVCKISTGLFVIWDSDNSHSWLYIRITEGIKKQQQNNQKVLMQPFPPVLVKLTSVYFLHPRSDFNVWEPLDQILSEVFLIFNNSHLWFFSPNVGFIGQKMQLLVTTILSVNIGGGWFIWPLRINEVILKIHSIRCRGALLLGMLYGWEFIYWIFSK